MVWHLPMFDPDAWYKCITYFGILSGVTLKKFGTRSCIIPAVEEILHQWIDSKHPIGISSHSKLFIHSISELTNSDKLLNLLRCQFFGTNMAKLFISTQTWGLWWDNCLTAKKHWIPFYWSMNRGLQQWVIKDMDDESL